MGTPNQGPIEPPKAARGHATYIDGKMLSVTKYSFQMYFRFHTCNDASAIANRVPLEMADIPSQRSSSLEIEDLSDTEGILLP